MAKKYHYIVELLQNDDTVRFKFDDITTALNFAGASLEACDSTTTICLNKKEEK